MNYRRFALFAFSLYAFFYDWIIEPQKKYPRSHSMECPALAFWTRPVFIAIGKDYTNPGSLKKKLDLYDLSWSSWVGAWWWIQLKPIEIDTNNDSFGVWNMIRTFENMPILGTLLKFQGSYLDLQKKPWKQKFPQYVHKGPVEPVTNLWVGGHVFTHHPQQPAELPGHCHFTIGLGHCRNGWVGTFSPLLFGISPTSDFVGVIQVALTRGS